MTTTIKRNDIWYQDLERTISPLEKYHRQCVKRYGINDGTTVHFVGILNCIIIIYIIDFIRMCIFEVISKKMLYNYVIMVIIIIVYKSFYMIYKSFQFERYHNEKRRVKCIATVSTLLCGWRHTTYITMHVVLMKHNVHSLMFILQCVNECDSVLYEFSVLWRRGF